jgi:hypothetical protein
MTARESTARAFAWFQAAYPSARKTDQSTVELWTEALAYESSSAIEAAARAWIRAEPRYPSLAGFLELVRAQRAVGARVYAEYCGACEDGWLETDGEGRGTVTRCPNGCLPPPMGELGEGGTTSTAAPVVIEALRAAQEHYGARRRELGDRAYLEERGYDPDRYRVVFGMILANAPETATPKSARAGASSRGRTRSKDQG